MDVKKEIIAIKDRNERVELDKKWETSWVRRIVILILTFAVVLAYNFAIQSDVNIFLSSLVPVMGFFLSTLSLGAIRKIWERKIREVIR